MPDHLTPLDAGFLELEDSDPNVSLAIAAIAIIDGPVPDHREFTEFVAARLAAIPHARQCVRTTSLDLRAPVWTDDPDYPFYRQCHEIYDTLVNATDAKGRKLKVYKLPMPEKPCFMSEEEANSIDLVNPRTAQDEPQIVEVWL